MPKSLIVTIASFSVVLATAQAGVMIQSWGDYNALITDPAYAMIDLPGTKGIADLQNGVFRAYAESSSRVGQNTLARM